MNVKTNTMNYLFILLVFLLIGLVAYYQNKVGNYKSQIRGLNVRVKQLETKLNSK